jgi:hypothetical protein
MNMLDHTALVFNTLDCGHQARQSDLEAPFQRWNLRSSSIDQNERDTAPDPTSAGSTRTARELHVGNVHSCIVWPPAVGANCPNTEIHCQTKLRSSCLSRREQASRRADALKQMETTMVTPVGFEHYIRTVHTALAPMVCGTCCADN